MLYNFLKGKLNNKKLVLLGELHGTKEIPELISKFFSEFSKNNDFNVCMEIPKTYQNDLNKFLKTGKENYLEQMKFFKEAEASDGRNSSGYLKLIKNIYSLNKQYKKNVKIYCVDISKINPEESLQEQREREMAKNIVGVLSEKITFAILGNIHASKKIINISNITIIPTGFYLYKKLKNAMVTVNLMPKKGKFYNLSVKDVPNYKNPCQISKNYDYTFFIKKVTHCSFLR